jgi:hypothetical protein
MSLLLIVFYCVGIQYERGGLWYICLPIALIGLVVDVIANYTELALITLDFPKFGEWTFSKRLSRLQYNEGWRGNFARYLAKCLNTIAPSGRHINE